MDGPAVVMIVLLVMTACTIVLWPLVRALARRLEGGGSVDAALRGELEQMHQRLAEVDTLQVRVGELEERLDFAERLLARGERDPATLPHCPQGSIFQQSPVPQKLIAEVPCASWDPETMPDPPGCTWFTTPPKPQP